MLAAELLASGSFAFERFIKIPGLLFFSLLVVGKELHNSTTSHSSSFDEECHNYTTPQLHNSMKLRFTNDEEYLNLAS